MDPKLEKLIPINFDNGQKYSNENRKIYSEEQRYNPNCPCRTRGCDYHGFCKQCVEKHRNMMKGAPPGLGHPSACIRIREGEFTLDPRRRS